MHLQLANKILDKYSINNELSNYLFYLLLHPTRILCAVPFYAKAIKKRFSSSGNPPTNYPQYIHTVYKEIKDSNFSPEVSFIESCFKKSPEKPETNCYGQRSIKLACGEIIFNNLREKKIVLLDCMDNNLTVIR